MSTHLTSLRRTPGRLTFSFSLPAGGWADLSLRSWRSLLLLLALNTALLFLLLAHLLLLLHHLLLALLLHHHLLLLLLAFMRLS